MLSTFLKPAFRVELSVEKRKHFYDVYDGEKRIHRFPGVTGFLDVISRPALAVWAKNEALESVRRALLNQQPIEGGIIHPDWINNVLKEARDLPEKIKDDAANLGTQAHAFIDLIIHGKEPPAIPEDIEAPIQAFKDWWKNSGIELIMGDTKVASLTHKYGGSLDALGRREGKFIILDWKTSNGIYKEYALQVSAYAQAFYETYGIYCQEGVIVRFGKKAPVDFEAREIIDLEKSFQAFLSAKALKEALAGDHYREAV